MERKEVVLMSPMTWISSMPTPPSGWSAVEKTCVDTLISGHKGLKSAHPFHSCG